MVYAEIACATGWTIDHIRHSLTLKRYKALKEVWRKSPPAHVCLAAICEYLGMKLTADEPQRATSSGQGEIYYDESYYDVEEQQGAAAALRAGFDHAIGR